MWLTQQDDAVHSSWWLLCEQLTQHFACGGDVRKGTVAHRRTL